MGKPLAMQDFQNLERQLWHQRYLAQAGWTKHIRTHILNKIKPQPGVHILEVGSGTGAILYALRQDGYHNLTGVDLDYPSVAFSKSISHHHKLLVGDGHQLPFQKASFKITLCHYLLMWTEHPVQILAEMHRVTQPGGWVLALAEPDHQARIDYPEVLESHGKHQTQALQKQGADTTMGRKLRVLFMQTGLREVETGILGAQWQQEDAEKEDSTEWAMIRADLENQLTSSELGKFEQQDQLARTAGERVLFIPNFYAFGKVP